MAGWQRAELQRLQTENDAWRARAAAAGAAQQSSPLAAGAGPSATEDPTGREVERLRGEAERLRRQLAAPPRAAATVPPEPPPVPAAPAGTVNLNLSVPAGATALAGGWLTPQGKRVLLLLTPEFGTSRQGAGQILLRTSGFEVPETRLAGLGLAEFRTPAGAGDQSRTLLGEEAGALLAKLGAVDGVDLLTAPQIMTTSGQAAEISVGAAGENGLQLHYLPTLAPDQSGVQVVFQGRLPGITSGN